MLINADFSHRAIITPEDYHWIASPQSGVERVMLDRIGAEKARATSLVRYAPNSFFPEHSHPQGEEILVLSGTFSESNRDYPAGWYLRNPDGSSHQPASRPGATILVKLRQMAATDNAVVRINTRDPDRWQGPTNRRYCPLFSSPDETVQLLSLAEGEHLFDPPLSGGVELFILHGRLVMEQHHYPQGSWIRLPPGDMPHLCSAHQPTQIYIKTGHLSSRHHPG